MLGHLGRRRPVQQVSQCNPGHDVQYITGFVEYSSFTEAQDAGMTCAWNPSGTCIASGSQDGTVTIWDPRAHRVGLPHRALNTTAAY